MFASAHVRPVFDTWLERLTAPFGDARSPSPTAGSRATTRTRYSEAQILSRWFPDQSDLSQDHPFCNNANAAIRRRVVAGAAVRRAAHRSRGSRMGSPGAWRRASASRTWLRRRSSTSTRRHGPRSRIATDARHRAHGASSTITESASSRQCGCSWPTSPATTTTRSATAPLSNLASIPAFRGAQFWGTYHGFAQQGVVSAAVRRRFYYPRGFKGTDAEPAADVGSPIVYEERSEVVTGRLIDVSVPLRDRAAELAGQPRPSHVSHDGHRIRRRGERDPARDGRPQRHPRRDALHFLDDGAPLAAFPSSGWWVPRWWLRSPATPSRPRRSREPRFRSTPRGSC